MITAPVEELHSSRAGPSDSTRRIIPIEHLHWSSDSGSQDSQIEFDSRNMKLRVSPEKQGSLVSPKGRNKKYQKEIASKKNFLRDSLLQNAVNAASTSSK